MTKSVPEQKPDGAPKPASVQGVLLTPGAGSSASNPSLVAIESALHDDALTSHIICARMNFPYRLAGKKIPDKQPVLLEAVVNGAAELSSRSGFGSETIVFGGRSMGGRMCSIAIANGLAARALVCICYPLHPPGKPEKLRVEHFPNLNLPVLFISGTKDAFGTPEELLSHTTAIPGPVTHHWIERAGHDLKGHDGTIATLVHDWIRTL